MTNRKPVFNLLCVLGSALLLSACSPAVGSAKWCASMKEQPKGEWTANELADFAKHCLLP